MSKKVISTDQLVRKIQKYTDLAEPKDVLVLLEKIDDSINEVLTPLELEKELNDRISILVGIQNYSGQAITPAEGLNALTMLRKLDLDYQMTSNQFSVVKRGVKLGEYKNDGNDLGDLILGGLKAFVIAENE